jgi:O-antigen/teichoic acid export membrane protein
VQNLIKSTGPGVLAVVLIYSLGWRVDAMLVSLVGANAAALVYSMRAVRRRYRPVARFDLSIVRDLFRFSSRLYLAGLFEHLNQYLTGLVLAVYMAPSEVAFFRMGQDRVQLLDQVPGSINTVLYPRLANTSADADRYRTVSHACAMSVLLLAGLGLLAALIAWPVVRVLYGRDFLPMVTVMWALLPGILTAGATLPITQYYLSVGRPGVPLWISAAGVTVQLALAVILLPHWGYVGAALALGTALLLQSSLRIILFTRHSGTQSARTLLPTTAHLHVLYEFLLQRVGMRPTFEMAAAGDWPKDR